MKRKKYTAVVKEADMEAEQIRLDPIAAGERLRVKLGVAVDERLREVNKACGDEEINRTLLAALQAWRVYYAFSHALCETTQRRIYECRWSLQEKVGSDFLKRRLQAIKGLALPTVELPALGLKILAAVETQRPKSGPKIFEGEN